MTPKIAKMKPKTSSKKQHIPRHDIYENCLNPWPYFSRKSASFSILSTNFTYLVFRDISLQPPKIIKTIHKKAPRNSSKSDINHARKNTDFWHRCWFDFDFKNDPKMTPKSTKMAPLGSQGAPWDPLGEPGGPPSASRPTFGSNLARQMIPK